PSVLPRVGPVAPEFVPHQVYRPVGCRGPCMGLVAFLAGCEVVRASGDGTVAPVAARVAASFDPHAVTWRWWRPAGAPGSRARPWLAVQARSPPLRALAALTSSANQTLRAARPSLTQRADSGTAPTSSAAPYSSARSAGVRYPSVLHCTSSTSPIFRAIRSAHPLDPGARMTRYPSASSAAAASYSRRRPRW